MIASMTGYGAATIKGVHGTSTVEIKTLNNRYFDINVRAPRDLSALEPMLRNLAVKRLHRGKAEVTVRWEPAGESSVPIIRSEILQGFHDQWKALKEEAPDLPDLDARSLLTLPGVLTTNVDESLTDMIHQQICAAFSKALDQLCATREAEGNRLADDLRHRAELIGGNIEQISDRRGEIVERYRAKLHERWEQICEGTGILVDQGRLEAEAMALADKADVTEEIIRLRAHLKAFAELIGAENSKPCGKPLDFLMQEFFREVNTIASKVRDVDVTAIVLESKHELEKMREQVQNLV